MLDINSFLKRCAAIKKIPVFASLGWIRIQAIARSGAMVRFKKGDIVSQRGNPPDHVFFVISGRLVSYNLDSDGKKDDVEFIHRGMFFGIISALTGELHSQTFETINDCLLFRIPAPRFRRILKKIPELGLKFSKLLSQRIRSKVTRTNMVSKSTIISVYAPIAGSGGSTFAFNLSRSLARETGEKVIFLSIGSSKAPEHTLFSDIDEIRPKWKTEPCDLTELVDDMERIPGCIVRNDTGVDMLHAVFTHDSQDLVSKISDFVSGFLDDYRYILVDLPSELDEVVMKTLSQSDLIYLVSIRKREALEIARATLDRIEAYFKEDFSEDRVKLVVSGAHANRNMSEETVRGMLDYDVLAFLPHMQRKDLALSVETEHLHYYAINESSHYWKTVTRLARKISGVSIGLVLGGGAAFGLAHIGVLRVLEEEGIPVDVIAGSSMGALIGSLWAVGYHADELERMACEFKQRANLLKLIDLALPISGIISGKAIMVWLNGKLGDRTFRDTRIPLKIVAYDLLHRQDVVIEDGNLVDAIRKSISIPGVFQPIVGDEQLIIDGGVMNPLPTNVLASSDVKRIIAVNVLQSPDDVIRGYEKTRGELDKALAEPFLKDPWNFIDVRFRFWINRTFFPNISDIIVRTLEASESVIAEQSSRAADVVIHPDLSGLNWYELYNAEILIARGEEAARKHLDRIRAMIQHRK